MTILSFLLDKSDQFVIILYFRALHPFKALGDSPLLR
jgi:hypothetical protein